MKFELERFYHEHLNLAYTSIDRIYLRGYVPILQTCGGLACASTSRPTPSWLARAPRSCRRSPTASASAMWAESPTAGRTASSPC